LDSALQVQLLCERNAEEHTVTPITVVGAVEVAVERVINFCEGESLAYPTFRYVRL
jgi:hypothetical protein